MSLQVWLPLNGSLENKGLVNTTINQVGSSLTYSDGKIGQALTFPNNPANYIYFTGLQLQIFTWTLWFKCTGAGASSFQWIMSEGRDYSTNNAHGTYIRINQAGTSLLMSSHEVTSNGITIELNKWYHAAMTADGTNMKFYLNGELKQTLAYTMDANYTESAGVCTLGKMSYSYTNTTSYFPFNGQINDVRIYDNALSETEIKEISKGLVLHLPLNNNGLGNENLLNDLTLWNKESDVTINWDSNQQMYKMVVNKTNNTSRWGIYQNFTVTPNTTYTFSVEGLKGDHTTSMAIGTAESSIGWPANRYTFKTTKTKGVYTFTSGASDTIGRIYLNLQPTPDTGNKTAWFLHPKLELGDKATPWSPNPADTLATTMGLNGTTEYDCSGFCNNGIRTGTFSWTSDAPKYNVSTKIITTSTGIKISNFYIGNIWTMSVWFKYPSLDNTGWKALVILNNYRGDADIQLGNYFNCNDGRIQYSANGKYNSSTYCTAGVWHHLVNVYDGTVLKGYLDGVQKCTITPGQTLLRSNLGIGLRSTAGDFSTTAYSFTNGQISDVRIYATALSEKDILSLYNNNAYIDSNGKIYGEIR